MINLKKKLPKKFYLNDVQSVAKNLLGKIFVRKLGNKFLSGKIVEVEAYDGKIDQAAHSFIGKTKRNEVMFNGGGYLYVYFTYGMHFCANVVSGKVNNKTAILIRAIEPIDGIDSMSIHRYKRKNISQKELINLTNGPAKICQALNIQRDDNGISLTDDEIFIIDNKKIPASKIVAATRIGIKKSIDLPWRYYIRNNPFVSYPHKENE